MAEWPRTLNDAVARELNSAQRTLEELAVTLCLDPVVFERHGETVQQFDRIAQVMGEVAGLLRSIGSPREAVVGIGLEDMRLRLVGAVG